MCYGGIFDTVDGGFSRYAVDMKWHIPHFEKMGYDNGQMVSLYCNAYKVFKNEIEKNEKVLDAEVKNHEAQLLIVKQNTFQHEIVKVDDHIRKLQIENATFKTKIESSLFAQKQFFAKETEYNQLINELNTKLSEIEVNHTTAQSKLNLIRTDLDKSSSENKLLSDELVTFNTAYNEKNVRFIQQQNKVNMYLKDCGNKEKQLEELVLLRLNDEKLIQTLSEELKIPLTSLVPTK